MKTGSKVMLLGKKYDPAQEEGYRQERVIPYKHKFKYTNINAQIQIHKYKYGLEQEEGYRQSCFSSPNMIFLGRCWRQRRGAAQWR